jgi:hypothetical protein
LIIEKGDRVESAGLLTAQFIFITVVGMPVLSLQLLNVAEIQYDMYNGHDVDGLFAHTIVFGRKK